MPGYAYERTCRRLAHRINSNTPSTRVTRNNVSLAGGHEWSNGTVQNGTMERVTARNSSRNIAYLEKISRILILNPSLRNLILLYVA